MILEDFKKLYHALDQSNIDSIDTVYASDILFTDPFHRVEGIDDLKNYFHDLYKNVDMIYFDFGESIYVNESYFVQWTMHLKHPKLNRNKSSKIDGATFFKVNSEGKIVFHRDYFDAGSMLYEQLPIIGKIIQWIKKKV